MDGSLSDLDPADTGSYGSNNVSPRFCQTPDVNPAAMVFLEHQAPQADANHPPVPPPPPDLGVHRVVVQPRQHNRKGTVHLPSTDSHDNLGHSAMGMASPPWRTGSRGSVRTSSQEGTYQPSNNSNGLNQQAGGTISRKLCQLVVELWDIC